MNCSEYDSGYDYGLNATRNAVSDIVFLIQTCCILLWEYLLYAMGRPIDNCVKNVSRKLGNINMFYVKVFQGISTNSQLLSNEQIKFLSSYTDNVPFGAKDIDLQFRSAIANVNREKEEKLIIPQYALPIKSGMIALIYEGYIGKQKVIIKVARKNIRNRLLNALRQIDMLVYLFAFIMNQKSLNIEDIISENKDLMMLQTDFVNEMNNIVSIREKYKNIDTIVIPRPYKEYTHAYQHIIVMDYLEGNNVMEVAQQDKATYAKQLGNFSLKGVLFDRIIHADLHPGNVIFMKTPDNKCQLGIIDFGVMVTITKQQQKDFYDFAYAFIVDKNTTKAFEIIVNAFIEPIAGHQEMQKRDFIEEIGNIIETALTQNITFTTSDIYLINKILYSHGYRLTKSFCKIEMALAIADSVCKQLNGENNYIDNILDTASKILTPDICGF
jgi:predicted unusual protein kinase regulating ubiquinone biosynthesis (AarF/ABC1/UbiB family)